MIKSLQFRDLLGSKVFDFLGKTGLAWGFSLLLVIGTVAGMWVLGKRILDIDLKGGSTARVVFNEAINRADITAALDAKDMVVNKEKITFVVSEMDDQEFARRSFKIDSNLPAPEDGDDWQTLDQVLEETFRGKLRLNGVNFDPATIKVEELNVERKTGAMTFPNQQLHQIGDLFAAVSLSPQGLMHSAVSYQPRQDTTEASGSETGNAQADNADQDQANAKQDELPGVTSGDFFNQQPQTPGKTVIQTKRYITSAKLNFENPITPRTLKSYLTEYASQIDVPLEEDQIKVLDDEGLENEVPAKTWTVKIETSGENDAKRVLEKYKSIFNELVYFPASSGVGGQIAGYAQLQAIVAIFVSFLGIVVYVWIRFQNIAFGLAAVLALIHDVIVVLGAIALSNFVAGYFGFLLIDNFKISLTVLAAILTVIGYSLNDTIVIFDRIREVRGKRRELTAEMVNSSLSQTLGRTILTSFTTFIVVLILYIRGGDSIHAFAFSLVVGVLVGTYSTIFIASPALVWLMNKFGYRLEEPKTAKT